jgi:hypothetical protein
MAEYEDGIFASQPFRDKNHFSKKADLSEVSRSHHSSELNVRWESISELGILAKTSNGMPCGNVISTYRDNIVVINFGSYRLLNEYIIPISRIKGYDGKYIYLSVLDESNLQPYVY